MYGSLGVTFGSGEAMILVQVRGNPGLRNEETRKQHGDSVDFGRKISVCLGMKLFAKV
jgi:hypothetical protein